MAAPRDFLSRDELLHGLPARRTSVLLLAIEGRTARFVDRARRAMAPGLTERSVEARERLFLQAVAEGRELPVKPAIQDLERYAPVWAPLVPADPATRASLFHALSERYVFTAQAVPALRRAIGADEAAVEEAYARLYSRPLATAYARELPLRQRLRWRRAAAARRLEGLPPVWLAFALTLTETVGGGVLALPIALADVGPAAAVVVLVVLGLVNVATVAAIVEAVTRDGDIRYGSAYYGRLVGGYLGRGATAVLAPALLVFSVLLFVALYIGVATTMADVTGVPAPVWAAGLFVAGTVLLRGEDLNATVASALVVGALNIGLIVLLAALALGSVDLDNLRHVDLPFGAGFDPSVLSLVFGVVLASYFGHTSAGNAAKVVLPRDPGGRALLVGNVAALAVAAVLYCLWVVAINGAVDPVTMANATGTALGPLADEVGPSVDVFGTVFVVLAMGMVAVHTALGVSNQVREWVPAARRQERGRVTALAGGRAFWLSVSPLVATFAVVEWLLASGRASFAESLNFLGTLTIPLIAGIFPMLMLAASRRKGEYAPAIVVRLLGQRVFVAALVAFYVVALLAYGLVIWTAPAERAAALLVAGVMVAVTVGLVARGAFTPRAFVEVRVEQARADAVTVETTVEGRSVDGTRRLDFADGEGFAALRSVTIDLPASRAETLKVRVHRVTWEGDSTALPATVDVRAGSDYRRLEVVGPALVPIDGAACEVCVSFPAHTRAPA